MQVLVGVEDHFPSDIHSILRFSAEASKLVKQVYVYIARNTVEEATTALVFVPAGGVPQSTSTIYNMVTYHANASTIAIM